MSKNTKFDEPTSGTISKNTKFDEPTCGTISKNTKFDEPTIGTINKCFLQISLSLLNNVALAVNVE